MFVEPGEFADRSGPTTRRRRGEVAGAQAPVTGSP